jgi:hypothetical protein
MPRRKMPRNSLTGLWLAACVAIVQSVAASATAIPTTGLDYQEIKLTAKSGKVFALGFMPSEPAKLYWAVNVDGAGHLYTYDLSTQAVKEMLGAIPGTLSPTGLTWSPDGRQAAIAGGPALKLVDLNTHAVHNRFLGTEGQWGGMFWTPNHSIISACAPDRQSSRRLCAVDTANGLVTVLATPGSGSVQAVGYIEGANRIIYERWAPDEAPQPEHVYSASIYPDHVGKLLPLSYPAISSDGDLSVTADGEYGAAIGKLTANDRTADVYVGDLINGNWVHVPSPADWGKPVRAMLSVDHRHLAVVSADEKGGYRLWLAEVPGKSLNTATSQ